MKTKLSVVVLVLIVATISSFAANAAEREEASDKRKISVSGEAVVYVKPDKAILSFSVESRDKDMVAAKQRNNDIVMKALAVIREAKVPETEMQTGRLSINAVYDSERYSSREVFLCYRVQNTVVIQLTDTAKLENLITELLKTGITGIDNLEFQSTELKKCREQARELALKAAKEKAVKMSAVLEQKVGAPLEISEKSSGSYSWRDFNRQQQVVSNSDTGNDDGAEGLFETIALGKLAIRASVEVVFELVK